MPGKDLYEYSNNVEMSELDIRAIMRQLASTLRSLHHYGILHCDIKLENIMMSHGTNDNP